MRSREREHNLTQVRTLLAQFPSLPFDDAAAEHAAEIRTALGTEGMPIGPHDVLIAAIARAHGVTLVTHNRVEFSRVRGLMIEDWET
jgi:tRNA(fMet)-specific endonuclease VapC